VSPARRLVLLDPGLSSGLGHHADVNSLLLPALRQAGWQPELWADVAAAPGLAACLPGLRPLLRDAGYIDPRHWCDLAGCLHQAGLLRRQLELIAAAGAPVEAWLAHSLLPFQLIALAQLLQRQPPARLLISLMFAPGELFAGQGEHELQAQRQAAEAVSGAALAALALAVRRGGHQLRLAAGSRQLAARYAPLCAASGLSEPELHPALTGSAGMGNLAASLAGAAPAGSRRILLHWGERKPDKGRELALAVLERLLRRQPPPALAAVDWCFHACGSAPAEENSLLQRAAAEPRLRILQEHQPRDAMLRELAGSDLVLLPYCPVAYAERSSGVLWLYGSARLALGRPALVAGFPGSWLAKEAPALGLGWVSLTPAASAEDLLVALAAALSASEQGPDGWTPYGRSVLAESFQAWVVQCLAADNLS
jgi:hypothetical protein